MGKVLKEKFGLEVILVHNLVGEELKGFDKVVFSDEIEFSGLSGLKEKLEGKEIGVYFDCLVPCSEKVSLVDRECKNRVEFRECVYKIMEEKRHGKRGLILSLTSLETSSNVLKAADNFN